MQDNVIMVYRQTYNITENEIVMDIPVSFINKTVLITIDNKPIPETHKMSLMKQATADPLFLSDLKEVNDDFDSFEHETFSESFRK